MGLGGGTGVGDFSSKPALSLTVTQVMRLLVDDGAILQLPRYDAMKPSPTPRDGRVTMQRVLQLRDVRAHREQFNVYFATKKAIMRPGSDHVAWEPHSYHVIRHGRLNISLLQAQLVHLETFGTLKEAGLIPSDSVFDPAQVYELDLKELPLLSRAMVDFVEHPVVSRLQGVLTLVRDIDALEKHAMSLPWMPSDSVEGTGRRVASREESHVSTSAGAQKSLVTCVVLKLPDYELQSFDPTGFTTRAAAYEELKKMRNVLRRTQYLLRLQGHALLQFLPDDRWVDRKVKRGHELRTLMVDGRRVLLQTWQERV